MMKHFDWNRRHAERRPQHLAPASAETEKWISDEALVLVKDRRATAEGGRP